MNQQRFFPQLIQVDPHMITFSPMNPRKHRENELHQLKKSLENVGMVQMPTVRVRAAQAANLERIWVVSVGILSDHEAATMLLAANAVRIFGFLHECRGLANLHRQGDSTATLAARFTLPESLVGDRGSPKLLAKMCRKEISALTVN
jgi:ParB-like chromosome segregation protein Spo0J